jgi:hypothetical protein
MSVSFFLMVTHKLEMHVLAINAAVLVRKFALNRNNIRYVTWVQASELQAYWHLEPEPGTWTRRPPKGAEAPFKFFDNYGMKFWSIPFLAAHEKKVLFATMRTSVLNDMMQQGHDLTKKIQSKRVHRKPGRMLAITYGQAYGLRLQYWSGTVLTASC